MIDTAQWATDLRNVIADLPVNGIFGGKTVQGCKSVLSADEVAAAAGELEGYRLSFYVLAADWTADPAVTPPENGDLLNVNGTDYRILRTHSDVVGMRYDLGDKYTERK